MAPRVNNTGFDDLITTISDNDDVSDEGSESGGSTQGRGTKRKRQTKDGNAVKKLKKSNDATEDANNDEDVDSEFEFGLEDGTADLDGYETLLGAGKAISGPDSLEAALRRRGIGLEEVNGGISDAVMDEESEDDSEGFGAGADLTEEDAEESGSRPGSDESDNENDEQEENDEDPEHPAEDEMSVSASDHERDPIEQEKEAAFFAPETNGHLTGPSKSFQQFSLSRPILKGLASLNFSVPTPIQSKAIPVALEGKDVVGSAVTGSGKTAAFMIPILERLMYRPRRAATTRVVILMPTRELALQCFNVAKKLASFTDITFSQAIGGLNQREQEKALKLRPDIVIGTPGRFIDLERNSPNFSVNTVEILVLDEADRMLEEGFAAELNEILTKIPKSRQTMLFSATMTSKVDDLVRAGLQRPVRLMIDAEKSTVRGLVQEFVRLRPGREGKRLGYLMYLCSKVHMDRCIVFFRQKKDAHRLRILFALCGLKAAELHGNMTQEQRIHAIEQFRAGKVNFLLATDLASRGLDIKGIEVVINYEAPQSHEIYLHRVGRTARAGRSGRSCTIAAEPDRKVVKAAVKSAKQQGAVIRQRTVDPLEAESWQDRCDRLQSEIEAILTEEKEDRALANTERDITRASNIVEHREEILARPKKTWFESAKEKEKSKERGAVELNGPMEKKAKKGKLSKKQKKKLEDKDERAQGMWKKGKSERQGGEKKAAAPERKGGDKKKIKGPRK